MAMVSSPPRYILHADLDAFYASVEQLDDPALKGKPVAVGGSPEGRGVVAAASYEARTYGVHSAMPMRTALRLCSDLVRMSPRFDRYHEVSGQVMAIFRAVTPLVEPLSLDEAYMDVTGRVPADEIQTAAQGVRDRVKEEVGLAVTIGGGTSKTVAKIASQLGKPDGLLLVPPGEQREFLTPLDVEMLWGVGPRTAALLRDSGIATIGDLAARDEKWLSSLLGKRGPELRARALGDDAEQVSVDREVKSVSAEVTMAVDEGDEARLLDEVGRLASRVAERLRDGSLRGKTVSVKLRLADFTTFTRQATLPVPTDDLRAIRDSASGLMRRELGHGRRFRLVGVGVSNFAEDYQLALLPEG